MDFLADGVPPGTIAVIDDSGGTLTAPIIEGFTGVICLGGSVRSHLGILAREYDVPTLMNCKIDDLADGDVVEIEVQRAPPAADAYETGDTGHARIWKIENGGCRMAELTYKPPAGDQQLPAQAVRHRRTGCASRAPCRSRSCSR